MIKGPRPKDQPASTSISQDVDPVSRRTLEALIVLDVHNKDVVYELANAGVQHEDDFEWLMQLRYYVEEHAPEKPVANAVPTDDHDASGAGGGDGDSNAGDAGENVDEDADEDNGPDGDGYVKEEDDTETYAGGRDEGEDERVKQEE